MSAFILSAIGVHFYLLLLIVLVDSFHQGQITCLQSNLLPHLVSQFADPDPLLRRWSILCLAKLWQVSAVAIGTSLTAKGMRRSKESCIEIASS